MTRRSMKRAAASVRWDRSKLATQVPSPVKAPDVWLDPSFTSSNPTPMIHTSGLGKMWTGEDTCRQDHRSDSERAGPRLRPPDGNSCSMHGGCFRASSAPRARSHRDKSARGVFGKVCVLWEPHRRAKTSASRSIGRTSPPFAPVQPRRRLNNSHDDDDANEGFVRNIDETSTRMNEFTNRARESGASSR